MRVSLLYKRNGANERERYSGIESVCEREWHRVRVRKRVNERKSERERERESMSALENLVELRKRKQVIRARM